MEWEGDIQGEELVGDDAEIESKEEELGDAWEPDDADGNTDYTGDTSNDAPKENADGESADKEVEQQTSSQFVNLREGEVRQRRQPVWKKDYDVGKS